MAKETLASLRQKLDAANVKVVEFEGLVSSLSKHNVESETKIQDLELELSNLKAENIRITNEFRTRNADALLLKEFDNMTALHRKLQDKVVAVSTELECVKKSVNSSFTASDLSAYLNKAISDFNNNTEIDDQSARYIINSMDVDLKANIFQDSENDNVLRFAAPNLENSTESSLSSIKISIRAIPK